MDEITESFRLNVTAISENCNKETVLQSDSEGPENENRRVTIVWTRKRDLTKDVYVEESQAGQLRVVKQVLTSHQRINYRSELDFMGRVARATDEPLFVDFIGWFPYKDHICLAMEYCPYGDLKACHPDPISEPDAREIGAQLMKGLAVLHGLSIVHRDIKPENVLVVGKSPIRVKIADFGVSKRAIEGQTELRTAYGTEGFMAPEILHLLDDLREDSTFTNAVDIWSLGCLLYYILTKQIPFGRYESLRDYAKGRTTFPEGYLRDYRVSRTGRGFLKQLLQPLPDARPAASVDVFSSWIISSDNDELADSGSRRTAGTVSAGVVPWDSRNPTQLSLDNTTWHGLLGIAHTGSSANASDEMDYFSTQLWNFLKSSRTPDRESTLQLQALLTTHPSLDRLHDGYTALHLVSESGPAAWVALLLEYGADTQIRTQPGRETALQLSTAKGDLADFLEKAKLLLEIRAVRADIDAQNASGDTALHLAIARFGTVLAIEPLLAAEASTNIKGRQGRTPLLYALYLEREAVATILLDHESDPHSLDDRGTSALHYVVASERISPSFVERLLDAGVDVDWRDEDGRTPLYLAAQGKKREVMRLLLDHGADPELGHPRLETRVRQVLCAGKPWASLWPPSRVAA